MFPPSAKRSLLTAAGMLTAAIMIATTSAPTMAALAEVEQIDNTLYITGGNYGDSVSIIGASSGVGTVGVYIADVPQIFSGVSHIEIDLGGGDDVLAMDRIRVVGILDIDLGDGNNVMYFGGLGFGQSQIAGDTYISALENGSGANHIMVDDVAVQGVLGISTGNGDDIVEFGVTIAGAIEPAGNLIGHNLAVATFGGDDVVQMRDTSVGWATYIHTGSDDDTVELAFDVQAAAAPERSDILMNRSERTSSSDRNSLKSDGESRLALGSNELQHLTVLTDSGYDAVHLSGNEVYGETLIELDSEDDGLWLTSGNTFYGPFEAHGGSDNDSLMDDGTNDFQMGTSIHSF